MLNMRNEENNTVFNSYFSPFCEYIDHGYARIHDIYRVNQAEYVIRIPVVAPQEYVNWPVHDIAITNIVWCMAYQKGVEGASYIAQ